MQITSNLKLKTVAFLVSVLCLCIVGAYAVLAWTEPFQSPPDGNAATPINQSATAQAKAGRLTAPEFYGSFGLGYIVPDSNSLLDGTLSAEAFCDKDYDICANSLNNGWLHVRNKANSAYKGVAASQYYIGNSGTYWDGYINQLPINGSLNIGGYDLYDSTRALNVNDSLTVSGNVGIGTTGPGAKLQVAADSGAVFQAGTTAQVLFQVTSNGDKHFYNTSGTENIRITNTGNVGIGTTAPIDKLHVSKNVGSRITASNDTDTFWASIWSGVAGSGTKFIWDDNSYLTFGTEPTLGGVFTSHMTIDNTGNVGIGTTGPSQKLDVAGYVKGTGLCIGSVCKTSWPAGEVGDITAVTAGAGLSGGGTSGSVTVNLDTSYADGRYVNASGDTVSGDLSVSGNTTVGQTRLSNSDIYFTKTNHNHTGIGNTAGYAAIENAANYNTLMILGRAGTSVGRSVSIWDYLTVNGSQKITGSLTVNGGGSFTSPVSVGAPTADSHAVTKSYMDSAISTGVGGGTAANALACSADGVCETNNISASGNLTVTGSAQAVKFDGAYVPRYQTWASQGTGAGGAAIYNDNGSYKALMVVGSDQGQGYDRWVRVWDSLWANTRIDAPIFRDSSNVNYYVDPASTSRLNVVLPNKLDLTTGNSPNSGYDHYGIYEEPGTWTHPYPDLMIAYHTGIKYVGYYGYGGHRFYTGYTADASPTTLSFSVGEGDHNTRVYKDLYVSGGGSFVNPVSVGSPVADGHAVTKSYMDSAISSGVAGGTHWTQSGSNLYPENTAWNVGIGNTGPNDKLDVSGWIDATDGYQIKDKTLCQWGGSASVSSGTWYRIASNSGNRANAQFTLRDYISSGGHSTLTFRAGISYNDAGGMSFTVLNHNRYGTPTFTKVRILEKNTYDPQYLEVYLARAGSVDFTICDNMQSSGWAPVNWQAGSVPSGYAAREFDVDKLFVVGDYDDRFTVSRGGNAYLNGNLTVAAGYVYGYGGQETLRTTDEWLRLNQASHFSSGVYTPGLIRADGGFQVDGKQVIRSDGNKFYPNSNVTSNYSQGVFWHGDSTAYAVYREAGSWTSPYPDLRIAFHTGIKLGAHASYNGIRFYNDYNMANLVMSVNDASTGGAGNVYMTGDLTVLGGGSFTDPVSVGTPTANSHAVTKSYMDSAISTGVGGGTAANALACSADDTCETNNISASGDITATGNLTVAGGTINNPNSSYRWVGGSDRNTFHTPSGYIELGPINTGWAHIYTDRPNTIFNTPVYSVADAFSSYDADLQLQRIGSTKLTLTDAGATVNGNLSVTGGYVYGYGGQETLRTTDEWLRLNQASHFSSGVYTPGLIRADGGFQVDGKQVIRSDGNKFYPNSNVTSNYSQGVFWHGDSTAYAVYREAGSWTSPYPDLRIAFHTGIKLGANAAYNGIRFYDDYTMSNLVMSVNDRSTGGDGNVYVKNDLTVADGLTVGDKLTVKTIDPVYEIDGKKYASYVSDFAGGVRTETSGIVGLNAEGKYIIDFESLETGSDLWLFWQTSSQNIDDLVVILTPGFNGKAWYEKQGNKLIIYGDKQGEVSYRLTLPREDYEEWGNLLDEDK